tara:strand:+ start:1518 stop:1919 length:402 start_codon:yes stop_codon:yes gene_type:complete
MNLTHYYWYFQSVIPENICDDITRYAKQLNDEMAVTGAFSNGNLDKKQIKDLKKKRNSSVAWMDDRWIYREIQPYIHKANQSAGWNFQWDFSESCQFTKNTKKINIMIGIVIVGINLTKKKVILVMEELENYL